MQVTIVKVKSNRLKVVTSYFKSDLNLTLQKKFSQTALLEVLH